MGADMTCGRSACRHYEEPETDHIEHSSLRSRSGILDGCRDVAGLLEYFEKLLSIRIKALEVSHKASFFIQ